MTSARRLFLDDAHISNKQHLIKRFHSADKHPLNPVILPDQPWERSVGHNQGTVMFEDGVYKFWYQMFASIKDAQGSFHCAYAESSDGVHWRKPELGLQDAAGSKANNVVAWNMCGINIVKDERETDPERKYKMLYFGSGRPKKGALQLWMGTEGNYGWCVGFSRDGMNWHPYEDNPVYTGAADCGSLLGWDAKESKYVAFLRPAMWKPAKGQATDYNDKQHDLSEYGPAPVDEGMMKFPHQRLIGRSVSSDFINWSQTRTVLTRDEFDPPETEFYYMPVFLYQDWYIGQLYILHGDPQEPMIRKKGFMDIQLAASRDGISWIRLGGQQPFIPRGNRGSFDMGMVGPNQGIVEKDGKLWFYYNGWAGEHKETKAYRRANDPGLFEMGRLGSGIGLATLRQDGFISLDAGDEEGNLETRAESFSKAVLVINSIVSGNGGYVDVEIRTGSREAAAGYSFGENDRFSGDDISHTVTWNGRTTDSLPEGQYYICFRLRNACLFSYATVQ